MPPHPAATSMTRPVFKNNFRNKFKSRGRRRNFIGHDLSPEFRSSGAVGENRTTGKP
jgi:hypothetical protein